MNDEAIKILARVVMERCIELDVRYPSPRVLEVVYRLVVDGLTPTEIARKMGTSPKTADNQLQGIRTRLEYAGVREMTRDLERRYFRLEARLDVEQEMFGIPPSSPELAAA